MSRVIYPYPNPTTNKKTKAGKRFDSLVARVLLEKIKLGPPLPTSSVSCQNLG